MEKKRQFDSLNGSRWFYLFSGSISRLDFCIESILLPRLTAHNILEPEDKTFISKVPENGFPDDYILATTIVPGAEKDKVHTCYSYVNDSYLTHLNSLKLVLNTLRKPVLVKGKYCSITELDCFIFAYEVSTMELIFTCIVNLNKPSYCPLALTYENFENKVGLPKDNFDEVIKDFAYATLKIKRLRQVLESRGVKIDTLESILN